jgi:hypothetical protein
MNCMERIEKNAAISENNINGLYSDFFAVVLQGSLFFTKIIFQNESTHSNL